MKKLLIFCACILLSNNTEHTNPKHQDAKLHSFIVSTYKTTNSQAHKVIYLANKKAKESFPSKHDILAIMSIESTFKSSAVSKKKAKGLMQVLYRKTYSEEDNVDAGVDLLVEYKRLLKSEKAAIIAYNVGIGNYKKGLRNKAYYEKFIREKELLKSIET